jgi:hypothetical protein
MISPPVQTGQILLSVADESHIASIRCHGGARYSATNRPCRRLLVPSKHCCDSLATTRP